MTKVKAYKTSLANLSRKLGVQLQQGRTIRMTNDNTGTVWEFDQSNNRGRFKNEINHSYSRVLRFMKGVQSEGPAYVNEVIIPFQIINSDGRLFEEFEAVFKPLKQSRLNSNY